MPLYQYRCRECGFDLEARQKFSDDPLQECPNCGAPQGLQRVIQSAGIVFKGSGFYINDSKGSKREVTAPAKKSDESATPAASTSSETTTSTPAAPASSESKASSAPSTSTPSAAL
jgi:putative FmdB family regulatory protein